MIAPYLLEEWLDSVNVTFDEFHTRMMGSWVFEYVEALASCGVRSVLVGVSGRVGRPQKRTHEPTGATTWLLPAPRAFLRREARLAARRRVIQDSWAARWSFVNYYTATPVASLRNVLRKERCDAVLVQDYEHARYDVLALLGRVMGVPTFACYQGCLGNTNSVARFLKGFALRAASGIISPARAEAVRLQQDYRLSPAKVRVIPNPVDVDFWAGADRLAARRSIGVPLLADVAVWHGAAFLLYKGLDVLMDAWDHVCEARHDRELVLLLVGTGPDAQRLADRVVAAHPGTVLWVNRWVLDRAELRTYLAAGDVYVFPSSEGFAIAPIEAMASGLPLVAADVSGIQDVLGTNGEHGGVVVPRRDPLALAAAVGRLLDDKTLARDMAARACARARSSYSRLAIGTALRDLLLDSR